LRLGVSTFAYDMKTINRMALGVASSVLLSAGLTAVAQRIDPLTRSVGNLTSMDGANDAAACSCACMCTMPCLHDTK